MQKNLLIISAALAALAVGGYALFAGNQADEASAPGVTEINEMTAQNNQSASDAEDGDEASDLPEVVDMTQGDPDAPVTIIEYSSFTCPHCASFNQGVYDDLVENYVDTGQVHWIKREVYFDAYGLWAALVARCGGSERYHGIVEMLYDNQRDWAGSEDGGEVAANLRAIGRRAGMNDDELNACLSDRDMATALMEDYRQNAERHGIRSTPSFVINEELHSNMSYAEFETAIANAGGQ
ncbi:MAG: Protein-disulfide isomerase [Rhodobacteraceae bacterium HLUCCA12]|nr:MAG: Protein-disulfide isomerase [Rhodobacteraceae bacterium HLUCCA12]